MTTEKWVQCTEELALNPEKVKAWRNKSKHNLRFIAYDEKDVIHPIIFRYDDGVLTEYEISSVQCLIEVPIQEKFITFYENRTGAVYSSLQEAEKGKINSCTHILKITFDGKEFQIEPAWTKL